MISDERFSKEERLAKTKDFRRIYKKGVFLKRGGLILYYLPNALEKNRLGFSIRAKNIRLAARRNRIRRLLREAYRRSKKVLKKGYDIVLVVKSDLAKTIVYRDAEEIFLKLAKEAGLLV